MKCFKDILFLMVITLFSSAISYTQEKDKALLKAEKEAKSLVYSGNEFLQEDDFVSAEMEFRKAISEQPGNVVGAYNLGKSYYERGDYGEALYRHQQVLKHAKTKKEKHYALHNIGNILMQEKKCKEASEAFKNALKNDPTDDETRYNYVLAKKCAEEQQKQQDQNKDQQDKEDKENQDKENKDKEGDQENDKQDKNQEDKEQGDKDKDKEGDQKEDEKQNPDKKDQEKEGKQDQKKPPKQKPGQLSPQQVKNLLEAMNAQEQKVQEKINAEKQKGIKIKTEKDW